MAKGYGAGGKTWVVEFQRPTITRDAMGQEQEGAWERVLRTTAVVMHGRGVERREAAAEGSVATATFRVNRGSIAAIVTARYRILSMGNTWDIHSIAPDATGRMIEFTATARGA